MKIVADNRAREKRAYEVCLQKITEHGLDMQLVSAECAFDGSKILFYFTADERVDFRELVKNLAGIFHTRIELRQIGVRDKAKMAKTQNLSLNPTKISGTCGRLMCCLKYEQDAYEDLIRNSPKMDSFVDTPEGRGTVVEVDLMRQRVKVRMEEDPDTISQFANTDIAVLRSGKAKKNDPPIPADLAPISGSGKRPRQQERKEEAMVLEPIRFRYREEALVEEPAQPEEPEKASEKQSEKPGRSRRRKRSAEGAQAPDRAEKPAEKKEKPAPKQKEPDVPAEGDTPAGDPAKKHRRRPNRRKKPAKPQEG